MTPQIWVNIGSGNGSSPVCCQINTWTNADILSIGPSGTHLKTLMNSIQYVLQYNKSKITQGCHRVAEKKIPWLFLDISLTANTNSSHCCDIYPMVIFCNYSKPHRNHIIHQSMLQHSSFENRSAQENVFNNMKIVYILGRTLCKTWKQIKFRKKSFVNDIWMRT